MKKVFAAIVGIAVVAFLGYTHQDQVTARFSCAEKLAHQFTTTQVVNGAYNCVTPDVKQALADLYGINTAAGFAQNLGTNGESYTYLGETADGGYTYRFDLATAPHSAIQGAFNDLTNGRFGAIWGELNGDTQGYLSKVLTFYLYPSGSTLANLNTGKVYDISGMLETIQ